MSERLAVFFDPCIFDHDTGRCFFEAGASPYLPIIENHPENGERTRNMLALLQQRPIADALDWHRGETARRADLERFHTPAYMQENIDHLDDFLVRLRQRHALAVKQA